ncbi:DEAD/DEAH box helicase family protein [Listeria monocytogenes]|uniref:type I site-specific deoxyribonuclease n=4 Tax=Listeria monocytogenes TaxID=1639 RepID=A0A9P1SP91_LISMN|nr:MULTISPECIES: type I restriction endonuclease [Listeria]EAD5040563.1 type I restriction endonuclease subunit R [Listeria monocytogenes serotype 1/2a]EAE6022989.1 type I restriction endonuclease subunit R [Listeria monocytogenes serotype 3a]EAG6283435.1 type I restriction endonuclease subunit R [Listeria monocytogenes CFSAN003810]EAH4129626.1 type I restriction endonuclease subunit R [Listeria monocytogenes LIS0077]MCY51337.1 type I restriction endonuclease subunit R [Listeria monocytogenes 
MTANKKFHELTRVQIPAMAHLTRLSYEYLSLKNLNIDEDTGIITDVFKSQFTRFNPEADFENEFKNIKSELDQDDLGRSFYERLTNGEHKLIDFIQPNKNVWQIAAEVEHERDDEKFRPDITIFINGLPLVFVEVKQPNVIRDGLTGIKSESKRTITRLKKKAFRRFNNITQLMIFSDNMPYDSTLGQLQGAYYTTPNLSNLMFNSFKEQEASVFNVTPLDDIKVDCILKDLNKQILKNSREFQTNLESTTPTNKILSSLLTKERILFFIQYGLVYVNEFDKSNGSLDIQKHVMRYPQFFATKAIENKLEEGIKKGVIWHTQGSGKTALAYHNIRYLKDVYQKKDIIPHFYFVVDRLDLADQAAEEFMKRGLTVKKISSSYELSQPFTHDVAVVNIQKFKNETSFINKSGYELREQNIYFIDEAHRSYNPKGSYLANLYNADKDSIKIALTGTPLIAPKKFDSSGEEVLENADLKTTRNIFGEYIHKYYYNDSIADGFTLRLIREDIETQYKAELHSKLQEIQVQQGALNKKMIYAHPKFVDPMLKYILTDLKRFRIAQGDESIGAMIVASSSEQAKELFKQFNEKYAATYGYTAELVLHDQEENKRKVKTFKSGSVDFLFVYSMLLTGFNAPRLKKLYLGRKIKAHNLLQTLTRVNRPYRDYKQGYVVDFADISHEFDKTNQAYLEELTREYDTGITGEDAKNIFGSLFVSTDEINQKLDEADSVLIDYPTDNLEVFSQTISDITDRKTLNELRMALITIKDNFQLARLLGHNEILQRIDLTLVSKMLTMLIQRISTLNQLENADDTSGEELLNLVMDDADFIFVKTGEAELQLAANDLQETKKKVASGLKENWDKKDPEYISLLEEFKRIMMKQNMSENNDWQFIKTMDEEYKKILRQIGELNRKNRQLAANFSGDHKYARVAKRLNLRKPSDNIGLYNVLKGAKEGIDKVIVNNENILDNDKFFESKTKEIVGETWRNLNGKINVSPQILVKISSLATKEYINEFEGAL